jgi:hypothetical protein
VNQPIEIKPGDGPTTIYVVAVLFIRRVAPSGTWGTGFGSEEVLLQQQFSRPGDMPLGKADAVETAVQEIRGRWADVMPPGSDAAHFAVSRGNVNATVVRPAAPAEQEQPHPARRRKVQ